MTFKEIEWMISSSKDNDNQQALFMNNLLQYFQFDICEMGNPELKLQYYKEKPINFYLFNLFHDNITPIIIQQPVIPVQLVKPVFCFSIEELYTEELIFPCRIKLLLFKYEENASPQKLTIVSDTVFYEFIPEYCTSIKELNVPKSYFCELNDIFNVKMYISIECYCDPKTIIDGQKTSPELLNVEIIKKEIGTPIPAMYAIVDVMQLFSDGADSVVAESNESDRRSFTPYLFRRSIISSFKCYSGYEAGQLNELVGGLKQARQVKCVSLELNHCFLNYGRHDSGGFEFKREVFPNQYELSNGQEIRTKSVYEHTISDTPSEDLTPRQVLDSNNREFVFLQTRLLFGEQFDYNIYDCQLENYVVLQNFRFSSEKTHNYMYFKLKLQSDEPVTNYYIYNNLSQCTTYVSHAAGYESFVHFNENVRINYPLVEDSVRKCKLAITLCAINKDQTESLVLTEYILQLHDILSCHDELIETPKKSSLAFSTTVNSVFYDEKHVGQQSRNVQKEILELLFDASKVDVYVLYHDLDKEISQVNSHFWQNNLMFYCQAVFNKLQQELDSGSFINVLVIFYLCIRQLEQRNGEPDIGNLEAQMLRQQSDIPMANTKYEEICGQNVSMSKHCIRNGTITTSESSYSIIEIFFNENTSFKINLLFNHTLFLLSMIKAQKSERDDVIKLINSKHLQDELLTLMLFIMDYYTLIHPDDDQHLSEYSIKLTIGEIIIEFGKSQEYSTVSPMAMELARLLYHYLVQREQLMELNFMSVSQDYNNQTKFEFSVLNYLLIFIANDQVLRVKLQTVAKIAEMLSEIVSSIAKMKESIFENDELFDTLDILINIVFRFKQDSLLSDISKSILQIVYCIFLGNKKYMIARNQIRFLSLVSFYFFSDEQAQWTINYMQSKQDYSIFDYLVAAVEQMLSSKNSLAQEIAKMNKDNRCEYFDNDILADEQVSLPSEIFRTSRCSRERFFKQSNDSKIQVMHLSKLRCLEECFATSESFLLANAIINDIYRVLLIIIGRGSNDYIVKLFESIDCKVVFKGIMELIQWREVTSSNKLLLLEFLKGIVQKFSELVFMTQMAVDSNLFGTIIRCSMTSISAALPCVDLFDMCEEIMFYSIILQEILDQEHLVEWILYRQAKANNATLINNYLLCFDRLRRQENLSVRIKQFLLQLEKNLNNQKEIVMLHDICLQKQIETERIIEDSYSLFYYWKECNKDESVKNRFFCLCRLLFLFPDYYEYHMDTLGKLEDILAQNSTDSSTGEQKTEVVELQIIRNILELSVLFSYMISSQRPLGLTQRVKESCAISNPCRNLVFENLIYKMDSLLHELVPQIPNLVLYTSSPPPEGLSYDEIDELLIETHELLVRNNYISTAQQLCTVYLELQAHEEDTDAFELAQEKMLLHYEKFDSANAILSNLNSEEYYVLNYKQQVCMKLGKTQAEANFQCSFEELLYESYNQEEKPLFSFRYLQYLEECAKIDEVNEFTEQFAPWLESNINELQQAEFIRFCYKGAECYLECLCTHSALPSYFLHSDVKYLKSYRVSELVLVYFLVLSFIAEPEDLLSRLQLCRQIMENTNLLDCQCSTYRQQEINYIDEFEEISESSTATNSEIFSSQLGSNYSASNANFQRLNTSWSTAHLIGTQNSYEIDTNELPLNTELQLLRDTKTNYLPQLVLNRNENNNLKSEIKFEEKILIEYNICGDLLMINNCKYYEFMYELFEDYKKDNQFKFIGEIERDFDYICDKFSGIIKQLQTEETKENWQKLHVLAENESNSDTISGNKELNAKVEKLPKTDFGKQRSMQQIVRIYPESERSDDIEIDRRDV